MMATRNSVVPPECGSTSYRRRRDRRRGPALCLPRYCLAGVGGRSLTPSIPTQEPVGLSVPSSTAAAYGYTCSDLTDPYTAAQAALELYNDYGFSPWAATY